jgi:uncharacterized membrane protein
MPLFGKPDEAKDRFNQAKKYSDPSDFEFNLDRASHLLEEALELKPQEKKYHKKLAEVNKMKAQFLNTLFTYKASTEKYSYRRYSYSPKRPRTHNSLKSIFTGAVDTCQSNS